VSKYFSVTINRLHIVSKFDDKGVKISEELIKVPVTFHDLPFNTAMMYRQKVDAADFTMVEQIAEFAPARSDRRRSEIIRHDRNAYHGEGVPPKDLGSEDITPDRETLEAAIAGDMAAAINAELEEAS
jgi:hypothetical protein